MCACVHERMSMSECVSVCVYACGIIRDRWDNNLTRVLRALDLYCGLGGWSDGLTMEGFEVLGVEILPRIATLYKHPCIITDVRTLNGTRFKGFDLIVGSPPCRDFVKGSDSWWKVKKDPARGKQLIDAFLRIVSLAKPRYWLMENVIGAIKYVELEPRGTFKLSRTMYRPFWGAFPSFLIPVDYTKKTMKEISDGPRRELRSHEKARIPLPIARSLGRAVARSFSS